MDDLRQSTIEYLSDSVCIDTIRLLINITASHSMPYPLNNNLTTRYPSMTTKVSTLIEELSFEEWLNTTNYSAYYETSNARMQTRLTLSRRNRCAQDLNKSFSHKLNELKFLWENNAW